MVRRHGDALNHDMEKILTEQLVRLRTCICVGALRFAATPLPLPGVPLSRSLWASKLSRVRKKSSFYNVGFIVIRGVAQYQYCDS